MNVLQHTRNELNLSQAKSTGPLLQRHSLKKARLSDITAYHGRLSSEMKSKVDNEFRSKEFQVLVATEAYEVGTHNPYVNLVLRVGCMRNVAVLVQEFGRAGRNNDSSDGIILANESIDDQRLIY